jgi:hypothetical protein
VEAFARLLLVLVAVALTINLVQGGPGQVREWLRAKFLGKPAAS